MNPLKILLKAPRGILKNNDIFSLNDQGLSVNDEVFEVTCLEQKYCYYRCNQSSVNFIEIPLRAYFCKSTTSQEITRPSKVQYFPSTESAEKNLIPNSKSRPVKLGADFLEQSDGEV